MVIIGGSGTGKSVLLKSILGLVTPDSGTITLDDVDVTKTERDPFLARFGMLFQGGALFDSMQRLGKRRLPPDARHQTPAQGRPAPSPSKNCAASA